MGSSPGEGMDVCKCVVHVRYGGTLNSRRATNPLVRGTMQFLENIGFKQAFPANGLLRNALIRSITSLKEKDEHIQRENSFHFRSLCKKIQTERSEEQSTSTWNNTGLDLPKAPVREKATRRTNFFQSIVYSSSIADKLIPFLLKQVRQHWRAVLSALESVHKRCRYTVVLNTRLEVLQIVRPINCSSAAHIGQFPVASVILRSH
ncbi:hypothetical protein TNCV_851991 [Trichonephila clavipes]|nr:hypothetical protein TNCV_851991 [Trichonephila clavipes]